MHFCLQEQRTVATSNHPACPSKNPALFDSFSSYQYHQNERKKDSKGCQRIQRQKQLAEAAYLFLAI
jgi:hypothetical protein